MELKCPTKSASISAGYPYYKLIGLVLIIATDLWLIYVKIKVQK